MDDGAAVGGGHQVGTKVRRGLAWSFANSLVLRAGNLVLGIVLAHLLVPADFGVFAIGLTIQSILVTFADLGMSTDLVRAPDPEHRAPTVATLSLLSSIFLATVMALSAGPVSRLMGSPNAAPVIAVLSLTIVLSGAGVVPYARLQREFQQQWLFATSGTDFVVSTTVTVVLVLLGMGPMALAISRIVAQSITMCMQFALAGVRPRFGFDRTVARSATAFGVPLAAANLLSWVLLNIDNIIIARVAGEVVLGLYVLAFNVSSWPMSAIGQAVRGVSLAGFARVATGDSDRTLGRAMALAWSLGLPAGALLSAASVPLVATLYGPKWSASAQALLALGFFGAMRLVFDLSSTYLTARGAARSVLGLQALWILTLGPVLWAGTALYGINGAGWSHVVVAAVCILPAYVVVLRRSGADLGAVAAGLWPPVLAMVPAFIAANFVARHVHPSLLALLASGLLGVAIYLAGLARWLLPRVREAMGSRPGDGTDPPAAVPRSPLLAAEGDG